VDHRICAIALDEKSVISRTPAIEQEREVAISDLLEANRFKPKGSATGPYKLALSVKENRLVFDIARESGARRLVHRPPVAERHRMHDGEFAMPGFGPVASRQCEKHARHLRGGGN